MRRANANRNRVGSQVVRHGHVGQCPPAVSRGHGASLHGACQRQYPGEVAQARAPQPLHVEPREGSRAGYGTCRDRAAGRGCNSHLRDAKEASHACAADCGKRKQRLLGDRHQAHCERFLQVDRMRDEDRWVWLLRRWSWAVGSRRTIPIDQHGEHSLQLGHAERFMDTKAPPDSNELPAAPRGDRERSSRWLYVHGDQTQRGVPLLQDPRPLESPLPPRQRPRPDPSRMCECADLLAASSPHSKHVRPLVCGPPLAPSLSSSHLSARSSIMSPRHDGVRGTGTRLTTAGRRPVSGRCQGAWWKATWYASAATRHIRSGIGIIAARSRKTPASHA